MAEREREACSNARIARLLKDSKLPLQKNLKAFDRKRRPRKVDAQLTQLLKGKYLDHKENVLVFGNPGSGKPHLLCLVAQEIIHQSRQVRFTPCNLLVQDSSLPRET